MVKTGPRLQPLRCRLPAAGQGTRKGFVWRQQSALSLLSWNTLGAVRLQTSGVRGKLKSGPGAGGRLEPPKVRNTALVNQKPQGQKPRAQEASVHGRRPGSGAGPSSTCALSASQPGFTSHRG